MSLFTPYPTPDERRRSWLGQVSKLSGQDKKVKNWKLYTGKKTFMTLFKNGLERRWRQGLAPKEAYEDLKKTIGFE